MLPWFISKHAHHILKTKPIIISTTNCFHFVTIDVGVLRYKVDFQSLQTDEPLDDYDLDDY